MALWRWVRIHAKSIDCGCVLNHVLETRQTSKREIQKVVEDVVKEALPHANVSISWWFDEPTQKELVERIFTTKGHLVLVEKELEQAQQEVRWLQQRFTRLQKKRRKLYGDSGPSASDQGTKAQSQSGEDAPAHGGHCG